MAEHRDFSAEMAETRRQINQLRRHLVELSRDYYEAQRRAQLEMQQLTIPIIPEPHSHLSRVATNSPPDHQE